MDEKSEHIRLLEEELLRLDEKIADLRGGSLHWEMKEARARKRQIEAELSKLKATD